MSVMRSIAFLSCFVCLISCAPARPALQAQATLPGSAPAWTTRWIPWETDSLFRQPWRTDERLARHGIREHPDDFRIVFANPDTAAANAARLELMWVRVIAHDSSSDRYLGYLLNEPHFIRSIHAGDNVVIRIEPGAEFPTAQGPATDYTSGAWPADANTTTGLRLREGLSHYRLGNNGHNPQEIQRCIATLGPVMEGAPGPSWRPSTEQRFIGHFVLGRCLAEKYETERAIRQFRAAVAIDSTDADAQLALLAELSVAVHRRPGSGESTDEARLESEFLKQLSLVRARFAGHRGVTKLLDMMFDPAEEAAVNPAWRPHIEKLRRVGYGVFRWKRR